MIPRLPVLVLALVALAGPALAQAGPPERRCVVLAEYALLLAGLRDDGVPAATATAALRRNFSPDPANLPSERNAAALAEAVYAHPDVAPETFAAGVRTQCLESLRARD